MPCHRMTGHFFMARTGSFLLAIAFCCISSPPALAYWQGGGAGGGGAGGGAGGILIDTEGVLQPLQIQAAIVPRKGPKGTARPGDVCVSLKWLSESLERPSDGPLSPAIEILGGLTRIDQVIVDRESRDILLIGPGEKQRPDKSSTFVGEATGRPLMRTGDFLDMLAAAQRGRLSVRCSIDPEPARLRQYNEQIQATVGAVNASNAAAWYASLARILGRQNITIEGISADSRSGNVLAAADYSMKRIALGLETSGVKEIKGQLAYASGDTGSQMKRWWFAPHYENLAVNSDRTVYQLAGPRVRLLAQQELVLDDGRRVNADHNRPSTEAFARQFSAHFEELTETRPIFADLKNQFDLAVVAALIVRERLFERAELQFRASPAWQKRLSPPQSIPRFVESGANLRRVGRGTIIGVVGGVEIQTGEVLGRESKLTLDMPPSILQRPPNLNPQEFSWSLQRP